MPSTGTAAAWWAVVCYAAWMLRPSSVVVAPTRDWAPIVSALVPGNEDIPQLVSATLVGVDFLRFPHAISWTACRSIAPSRLHNHPWLLWRQGPCPGVFRRLRNSSVLCSPVQVAEGLVELRGPIREVDSSLATCRICARSMTAASALVCCPDPCGGFDPSCASC